jgi:hypothetical protein
MTTTTTFTDGYDQVINGLWSNKFSSDKTWQTLITRARDLVGLTGFQVSEASLVKDLRQYLEKAVAKGDKEAVSLLAGAGEDLSGTGPGAVVGAELAMRLGTLKTLRHTYLLKRFGSHKVWCLSLPKSFSDWPHKALKGDLAKAVSKLDDTVDGFTPEQRKHLGNASQEGLKWVHKAMWVSSSTKKKANFELVARWFADRNSTDADVEAAGGTLNAGLKKLSAKLKSDSLIYTDSVSERSTNSNKDFEAFVFQQPDERLDVVYIEEQFFGSKNSLSGLTNWTRIVVHELTHRELHTKDHAYEHQGINPTKLGAAKALENADSWAWFCADCAGALQDTVIKKAMDR